LDAKRHAGCFSHDRIERNQRRRLAALQLGRGYQFEHGQLHALHLAGNGSEHANDRHVQFVDDAGAGVPVRFFNADAKLELLISLTVT
jgi:hypothetical protein